MEKKLKYQEADFVMNGVDLIHNKLEYNYMNVTNIANGCKENIKYLNFCLSGEDISGKEGDISFQIDLLIDDLKKLEDNKIIDITNHLVEMEALYTEVGLGKVGFMTFVKPTNTIDDMYSNLTSLYVYKESNSCIFKFSNPNDNIFAVFKINIDEDII